MMTGVPVVPAREVIPGVLSRIQDAPLAGQGRAGTSACAPGGSRRRHWNTSSWRASPPLRAARSLNVAALATISMLDPCVDSSCKARTRPVPDCQSHGGFLVLVHLPLTKRGIEHLACGLINVPAADRICDRVAQ